MSELELMKVLWVVSTLSCTLSTVGMFYVYKSIDRSFHTLARVTEYIVKEHYKEEYEAGISRMAKDTEVAK